MSTIPGTSSYPRAKSQKSEEGPSDVDIRLAVFNKKGEIQIGTFKFFKGGRSDGKTDVNIGEILGRYKKRHI